MRPRTATQMTAIASGARRRWLGQASATVIAVATALRANAASAANESASRPTRAGGPVRRLFTFGDSVLDCRHYNDEGLDPGRLLVHNDDRLFPEFRGRDLQSRGPTRREHCAVDGATVSGLAAQAVGVSAAEGSVAIVSVGGNDLLRGLATDTGPGLRAFEAGLDRFLRGLPIRPVVLATVYDPTFGDDARNFLGVDATIARANHRRVDAVLSELAARHDGQLADLHAHFLRGDPSWFTRTIEPSLRGASEVRRVFLAQI